MLLAAREKCFNSAREQTLSWRRGTGRGTAGSIARLGRLQTASAWESARRTDLERLGRGFHQRPFSTGRERTAARKRHSAAQVEMGVRVRQGDKRLRTANRCRRPHLRRKSDRRGVLAQHDDKLYLLDVSHG